MTMHRIDSPGVNDFIQLGDVPHTYAGSANYSVVVNSMATGLTFVPGGGGGTIGGSIDANQIAYGSGTNTIQGSYGLTYNGANFNLTSGDLNVSSGLFTAFSTGAITGAGGAFTIDPLGNLVAAGKLSFDGTIITSDGSGNLTANTLNAGYGGLNVNTDAFQVETDGGINGQFLYANWMGDSQVFLGNWLSTGNGTTFHIDDTTQQFLFGDSISTVYPAYISGADGSINLANNAFVVDALGNLHTSGLLTDDSGGFIKSIDLNVRQHYADDGSPNGTWASPGIFNVENEFIAQHIGNNTYGSTTASGGNASTAGIVKGGDIAFELNFTSTGTTGAGVITHITFGKTYSTAPVVTGLTALDAGTATLALTAGFYINQSSISTSGFDICSVGVVGAGSYNLSFVIII